MSGPESFKSSPKLPEDMTAEHLLEEVSEKDRAAIAKSQGVSPQEFDRFLGDEARKTRISGYINQAKEVTDKIKSETTERNENDIKAEQAVIQGLEEALWSIETKILSAEEIEKAENDAYKLIDQLNGEISAAKAAGMRRTAENLFKKIATSEALSEISKRGNSAEVIKELSAALRERANRQNIREYSHALIDAARELEWGIASSPLSELPRLISSYKSGSLNEEQKDLLRRLARYGKNVYIAQYANVEKEIERFHHLLKFVADGYRKYGPHRTEASNVSGPSEVFGSYQSDKVSGYRSDSKRRPHRDPSGGNGES